MVIAVERPDVYHQLLQISMLSQNVRLMERRIKTVVLRKQATQDAKLMALFIGVIYAETQMITLASTANKEISPQKPKRRLENNRKLMQQWRLKNKDQRTKLLKPKDSKTQLMRHTTGATSDLIQVLKLLSLGIIILLSIIMTIMRLNFLPSHLEHVR